MVENRPDWCISRQRAWGVPIVAFTCKDCGELLLDKAIVDHVADIVEKEGADVWFTKSPAELLPHGTACKKCGKKEFEKEMDILDVWFDSGVSHAAVLKAAQGAFLARGPVPRRERPAPGLVPVVAPHLGRDNGQGALPHGADPRLHRGRLGQEDEQVSGQRGRAPGSHRQVRGGGPAALGLGRRLPRRYPHLAGDPDAPRRGLPQDPEHQPLPSGQPLGLRSGKGQRSPTTRPPRDRPLGIASPAEADPAGGQGLRRIRVPHRVPLDP